MCAGLLLRFGQGLKKGGQESGEALPLFFFVVGQSQPPTKPWRGSISILHCMHVLPLS